ncbi:iron complex outermembrane receptor protein [Pedobacter duraquae]|uniref:Iron complex outermembrane receptor protein n=2 Tax=Pedobacter duraquae TaxID=425511 RepID=A0A4V3C307_9SPHI|nr:iron complex outermembrane receptor protein [Pedobacter duraquae]
MIFATMLNIQAYAQNQNGSLSGTVKTSDGAPASFVTVVIKDTKKGTITSENGEFTIKGLKPGNYILKISFTGLQTQEKTVDVIAGQTTHTDFNLAESANRLTEIQIISRKSANQKTVTVGKSGILARDLPQSVQILDSTVIRDQQVNRLADVLKNVNGVALGENRGSVNESFFARGYSLGANNVLKNGVRSSSGGVPEASTLESVEVLKGSAALLYGGVTGGAVVNMVTKKPKFNYGGEVSMRVGSYDFYKPTADIYGPISKTIAFRVIATKENANSFRDIVKSDRLYINPSLLFKLGTKTELLVQGDYLKSDYTPDFGLGTVGGAIPNIPRSAFLNTVWAYNNTNTATAQANVTHRFSDSWKLNAVVAYQSYNRDYFGAERPVGTATGISPRSLTRSKSQEYTYNQQLTLTGIANTGRIRHQILIGGDADQSNTTSYAFKYDTPTGANYGNFNILDPSTYNTRQDIPNTRISGNTYTPVYRMGAFVQDLISLTEKFKVLAGVRYTFQKMPRAVTYDQDNNTTTLASNSLPGSKVEHAFSPKFGLIYQPLKSTSLYASYASNFTSNTGTDIYKAALDPSIIDQYEMGIKNDFWDGKMSFNVTAYKIKNSNLAQTALLDQFGQPNADATVKEFSGATTSDGLEIDVTGKIAKGLNFLAGYSYNYYRYTKTLASGITEGERVIGSTKATANGTLFYTFSEGIVKGLKLGASAFVTGKRFSGFQTLKPPYAARGLPVKVSGFTTIDLTAGYTYKKLSFLAKVSNITDELNYYVHENYSVNPIPPRTFMGTVAYRF